MSVHLRDIESLHKVIPELIQAFEEGKFCIQKTKNRFSSITMDEAREQLNCKIKCSGCTVGLFIVTLLFEDDQVVESF